MTEIDGPRAAPASGGAAKQLVILAHGYGADGQDLIGQGNYIGPVLIQHGAMQIVVQFPQLAYRRLVMF